MLATNSAPLDELFDGPAGESSEPLPPFELKQQIAERVAAHRARRGRATAEPADAVAGPKRTSTARGRSASIAAAVAERFAQSPSYRTYLAAEAERSVQQAQAAASIATINAQAIAMAQQQLLEDLDQWSWPETDRQPAAEATEPEPAAAPAGSAVQEVRSAGFTVRLYQDSGRADSDRRESAGRVAGEWAASSMRASHESSPIDEIDLEQLEAEIAFRQDPYFETATPPEPLPANLIEFPRQLVAARKARPQRALGPLLDEAAGAEQMRIFEVQASQVTEAPVNQSVTPEWTSITLGALPSHAAEPLRPADFSTALPPLTAPLRLRCMAGAVDAAVVLSAAAIFLATATKSAELVLHGAPLHLARPVAAAMAGGSVALLTLTYLLLCFTLAEGTAGMRYARIALCTFGDENPTRKAMRRRILAMALSAAPVGLGFLWAAFDEDCLGWHDRMSRMYQRAY